MVIEINKEAWEILDKDERTALTLQYGHDKSSWQSGEIMSKSHYKYLEIKDRGEVFLKIFTEHLSLYGEVIPSYIPGNKEIKAYFIYALQHRWPVNSIHLKLDAEFGKSAKKSRNIMIIEQMNRWEKSGDAHQMSIYQLIKEFDRWNNFRVLPPEIQEPSAFKRRNKNAHKRNIKGATTVPDITIEHLLKMFKGTKVDSIFLPLITRTGKECLLCLRKTQEVVDYISNFGLYLFEDKKVAENYLLLIQEFSTKSSKTCKEGLDFWPKYRNLISYAYNHDKVQKISPTRKYPLLAQENLKKPKN